MKNYSQKSQLSKQPEETAKINREPVTYKRMANFLGSDLKDKTAIITGGDSGIWQAIAILYANFGINSVIVYYDEDQDTQSTINQINDLGATCKAVKGDIRDAQFCQQVVDVAMNTFGSIDILINNASVQYPQNQLENISSEQPIANLLR